MAEPLQNGCLRHGAIPANSQGRPKLDCACSASTPRLKPNGDQVLIRRDSANQDAINHRVKVLDVKVSSEVNACSRRSRDR
jgi:hypothetical protein